MSAQRLQMDDEQHDNPYQQGPSEEVDRQACPSTSGVCGAEEPLIENEPYLGPAWAVVMLVLYLLKEAFPAEQYSLLWWFQVYIIVLVIAITIFTLVKRHQFYRSEKKRRQRVTSA
ncbi:MAG: hypothetical protein KDD69_19165 [Bdellovibrionales bacterium]|nr:hypothetical protein [Bdellovibrionales bacterium]